MIFCVGDSTGGGLGRSNSSESELGSWSFSKIQPVSLKQKQAERTKSSTGVRISDIGRPSISENRTRLGGLRRAEGNISSVIAISCPSLPCSEKVRFEALVSLVEVTKAC